MTSSRPTNSARSVLLQYVGMLSVLALLVLIFSLASKNFLSSATLASVTNQIPDLTVIAVGMTLVLIIGGIDLSVGSMLALSAAVLGYLMVDLHWSVWQAVPLAILASTLCGLINGSLSVLARIPSFIV